MIEDPIVAEVRRAREQMLREAGGTLQSLAKYLQRRRRARGIRVVRMRPKRIKM
ncbi:MAG TPA: hypothetical protein VGM03_22990 [Phycisphaerae bacterium]|jgi:hypothetical protein